MTVWFRVYGHLNVSIAAVRRERRFMTAVRRGCSVGEAIFAIGVPRQEVDLVVVNGTPVTFTHALNDGDQVAVYPRFHSIDLGDIVRARG